MFRCHGQLGHDGAHVADVHYFFDGYLDGYTANWVRSDRFVEHVPNEEGVRFVLADDPPVTCGRCGGARHLLGTVDSGVTSWRCEPCEETQFDVHCNEDEQGTLTWIDSIESVESAHDENA